ncbi:MAG TPA: hypothetical protein VII06_09630 [Chloroflexota bacterium]|jgi:hypothetical protein
MMAVKAKFIGPKDVDGRATEFHAGIPARDLTDEEWELLSEDEQATVEASALYEVSGARRRRADDDESKD